MKTILAAMLTCVATPLLAETPATCQSDTTRAALMRTGGPVATVLALDDAYEKAILASDSVKVAGMVHANFYYVHAGKSKQDDKTSWVASIARIGGNYTCRTFTIDKVVRADNLVLLSGTLDVRYDHAKAPNAPTALTGILQRTYVREGNRWQLLAQTVGYIQPNGMTEGRVLDFLNGSN